MKHLADGEANCRERAYVHSCPCLRVVRKSKRRKLFWRFPEANFTLSQLSAVKVRRVSSVKKDRQTSMYTCTLCVSVALYLMCKDCV